MQHSSSRLLYDTLASLYDPLGFTDAVNDRVFRDLVIARIIEPASKLDTIRILENLGLKAPSNSGIHRSLNQAADNNYRDKFSAACVTFRGTAHLTPVLYDVTTLFFQVEQEDEYRKPGLSKERRLEPQIVVGLLVDERGFPLQLHSFEGNKAETLTLVPVLDAFRAQHPEVTVSVACDAGMLSAANLLALEGAGYSFIVGSRIAKTLKRSGFSSDFYTRIGILWQRNTTQTSKSARSACSSKLDLTMQACTPPASMSAACSASHQTPSVSGIDKPRSIRV